MRLPTAMIGILPENNNLRIRKGCQSKALKHFIQWREDRTCSEIPPAEIASSSL